MEDNKERIALKLIQISDLHITEHRDLLSPMIDAINREAVDLVVVTGDTVHSRKKELYKKASEELNKIRHRVVVLPGDYDNGALWHEYFGNNRFNSINLNGFCIDLMDTSFMEHRFSDGWGDVIEKEDPEQDEWIKKQLSDDKYHIVFSHHPFWVNPTKAGDKYATNALRAVFSGHIHEAIRFYFNYDKPMANFKSGFTCVPMKFHGNSCYMVILVKANGEMVNIPRVVGAKRTAW
uniref:Putative calcineurin-like phosphoesterase n=1 Tax=viral metagenome TaxID=1070528 RepID=A0A6M3LBE7_9ZZZZ